MVLGVVLFVPQLVLKGNCQKNLCRKYYVSGCFDVVKLPRIGCRQIAPFAPHEMIPHLTQRYPKSQGHFYVTVFHQEKLSLKLFHNFIITTC